MPENNFKIKANLDLDDGFINTSLQKFTLKNALGGGNSSETWSNYWKNFGNSEAAMWSGTMSNVTSFVSNPENYTTEFNSSMKSLQDSLSTVVSDFTINDTDWSTNTIDLLSFSDSLLSLRLTFITDSANTATNFLTALSNDLSKISKNIHNTLRVFGLNFGDSFSNTAQYALGVEDTLKGKYLTGAKTYTSFEGGNTYDDTGNITTKNNPAIEAIMRSGPDAMSNMFDVFFVVNNNDFNVFLSDPEELTYRKMLSRDIFATRITGIEIPFSVIQTYQLPFCGDTLSKGTSKYEMKTSSSFSIRADQSLYYIDLFNRIAHTSQQLYNDTSPIITKLQSQYSSVDIMNLKMYFNGSIGGCYTYRTMAGAYNNLNTFTNGLRFDIVVRRACFKNMEGNRKFDSIRNKQVDAFIGENVKEFIDTSSSSPFALQATTDSSNQMDDWFVFEDVKMLGTGDKIKFERESAGPEEITYDFIFKRLYRKTSSNNN
jgi:hypothetical protein